jgi:hypothetical protein
MANQFSQLFTPTGLTTSSAVVYPMPTSPTTTILRNGRVLLTNYSSAIRTVTLYADVAATASSDANAFAKTVSIPVGGTMPVDLPVMKAGDTLRGLADAATSVTIWHSDGFLVAP